MVVYLFVERNMYEKFTILFYSYHWKSQDAPQPAFPPRRFWFDQQGGRFTWRHEEMLAWESWRTPLFLGTEERCWSDDESQWNVSWLVFSPQTPWITLVCKFNFRTLGSNVTRKKFKKISKGNFSIPTMTNIKIDLRACFRIFSWHTFIFCVYLFG